jgi:preprotein translocase subunit SecE
MKKIVWPTKSQIVNNTLVVIAVSLIAAVLIFGLDTVFGLVLKLIY